MKLREKIQHAVTHRDMKLLNEVTSYLRFTLQFDTVKTFKHFEKHTGISPEDFELLMQDLDDWNKETN